MWTRNHPDHESTYLINGAPKAICWHRPIAFYSSAPYLRSELPCKPTKSLARPRHLQESFTYRIPEFERKIEAPCEVLTVLEPIFALGLDLLSCLDRCRVRLQWQIVQIRAHGNAETAVVIIDKRQSEAGLATT